MEAAALEGRWIKLLKPWSQLGGPPSKLVEPAALGGLDETWSQLGEPAGRGSDPAGRNLKPGERALKSAGRVSEPAGGGRRERERQNGAFLVCGGTIGHCPL